MKYLRAHRTLINGLMIVLLAFWQIGQPLQAATFYWDNDANATGNSANTGAGLGVAGMWDTAAAKWWNLSSDVAWNNGGNDTALFWGTAGAVTLGTNITVGGLTFNTTGYTITNGANTLTFGAASNAITLNNVAAATITGAVGGTGDVTLTGGGFGGQTAGTLTLNGTSTGGWSGATTINTGMTMALSGNNQALLNTAGITLNGGGLTLTNIVAEAALDRVANGAGITSNGGTITFTNTNGGTYAETLGSVALSSGQLNIVEPTTQTTGTQTLTLSGLTRTGATNTSGVTFSAGTTAPNTTRNMIVVSGATATPAGQIIGPWATVGTTAALQSDYAVYNGSGQVVPVAIAGVANDSTFTTTYGPGSNYAVTASYTAGVNANINTLRYGGGAAGTITMAAGRTLGTFGILTGSAFALTVGNTAGTGTLTLPTTSADNLHVTSGSGAITINANINDNTGALTLVKGGALGLTLAGTGSTFSGGLVINAGTVSISADANLGAVTGDITFNGSGGLTTTDDIALPAGRSIILNNGAIATYTIGNQSGNSVAGQITGTGSLVFVPGGTTGTTLTLSNTTNNFQGILRVATGTTSGILVTASLADSAAANGVIRLGGTTGTGTFQWSTAATGPLTLNNRQIDLSGTTGGGTIDNANATAGNAVTINTDLLISGAGAKTLTLQGANTGANAFNGKIFDGVSSVIALTKAGAGTWTLGGANTYSGATTVSAGTLNIIANQAGSTSVVTINGGTYRLSGAATKASTGGITINSTGVLTVDNTTASGGVLTNRLNSAVTLGGGQLNYNLGGSAAAATDAITTLNVTANAGYNNSGVAPVASITLGASTSGASSITVTTLARSVGGTLLVSGPNLGEAVGTGSTNLIFSSGSTGVTGGTGLAGSTTVSITPYIIGQNTSLAGNAQFGFVTDKINGVVLADGLRNLTAAEYTGTITDGQSALDNVSLAKDVSGIDSATTINALRLDAGTRVSGSGTLTVGSGAILALGNTTTFSRGSNSITGGTLAFGSQEAIFHTLYSDLTICSTITGSGGVSKTGNGLLVFAASNTLSGPVSVSAGMLRAGTAGSVSTTGALVMGNRAGAILDLSGMGTTSLGFNATFGSIAGGGALGGQVMLGGGSTLMVGDSSATTYAGVISGNGSLVKTGTGTLTLSGANVFAGTTTINAGGTLRGGIAAFLPAARSAAVNGTLDLNSFAITLAGLSGAGVVLNSNATAVALTLGNQMGSVDSTFSGVFNSTTAASLTLTKNGGGTLTLTNSGTAGTATGAWTLTGGTLKLDYANAGSQTGNIINAAIAPTFAGGTLNVTGRSGATVAQTLGAVTLNAGGSKIFLESGGGTSTTLTLGALGFATTPNGGSLLITAPANTFVKIGTAITAALPNGRVVFSDGTNVNWATNAGAAANAITGGVTYTANLNGTTISAGTNASNSLITVTGAGQTTIMGGALTTHTLKIDTTAVGATGGVLSLGGNLTLDAASNGAILFTGANDYTISGAGSIVSAIGTASDVIIHTYGTGRLILNAAIGAGTGAQTLTKTGPGTLVLGGTNINTGATFINNGTLSISASTNIGGTTAAIAINDGATLQITGGATVSTGTHTYSLTGGNATIDLVNASTQLTAGGVMSGAGGLSVINSGTGTAVFNPTAVATFTGPTFIGSASGGSVTYLQGIASSLAAAGGTVTVNATGSINMNNLAMSLGGLAGSGDVGNSGATAGIVLTVGGNNLSTTYSGVLQNTGTAGNMALTKTGTGTLTLTGSNKHTGNTLIAGGVLQLGASEALTGSTGNGTAITLGNAAGPVSVTFDLNGNTQTLQSATTALTFYGTTSTNTTAARVNIGSGGNLILKGNVVSGINATASNGFLGASITGGTLTLDGGARSFTLNDSLNAGDELTITSVIASANGGSLTKAGAGTLVLAGNNTMTGPTLISAGTVRIEGTNNASAFNLGTSGTSLMALGSSSVGSLTGLAGTALSFQGTLTVGADGTSPGAFAGNVSGIGSLVKTGAGALILSGSTINYTGNTVVNGGTLSITGSAGAAPATSALTVAGGAAFELLNDAGQSLNLGAGALILGTAAQTTTLGLELGAGAASDIIVTSSAATTAGIIQLNLAAIAGFGSQSSYNLIMAASGLDGASYSIGSAPGGYTYSLTNSTGGVVQLDITAGAGGALYWRGDLSNSWSTLSGGSTNWWLTPDGTTTNAGFNPGAANSVIFSTSNNAGGAIVTSLDSHYVIQDLQFNALSASATSSVTINSGSLGSSSLTLTPAAATEGINIAAGAVTTGVTMNVPITLGAAQTWTVADAGVVLTLAGVVSGSADLTKAGLGTVAFGAGNTFSGNLAITNGVLSSSSNTTPFGSGAGAILLGDTTVSNSNNATLSYSGTATTVSNPITVRAGSSGTLSILGLTNTHTYTGAMTLNNSLTVDNNTATKTTTFSGGVAAGNAAVSISKLAGAGAVVFSTAATTVGSGGLTLNTAGGGLLTFSGGFAGTGNLVLNNNGPTVAGITLSTNSINHTGTITNSGSNAGTGTVTISGIIGPNVTGVYQNSATSNLNLSGVNTFTYDGVTNFGLNIQAGAVNLQTSASALGTGRVTLGDDYSLNANNASLLFATNSLTIANPIYLADRSTATGTLTVGIVAATVGTILSGGVTGNNDLTVVNSTNGSTGRPSFTGLVNNSGTITLIGTNTATTAATTFSSIGSNVTAITQNSAGYSSLSVAALAVNSGGTTLTNNVTGAGTTGTLVVTGAITGTGNLILNNNNSTIANAVQVTGTVNHVGTITSSGTGTSGTTLSAVIGTNVGNVIQNSATSVLTLGGVANTWSGGLVIKAGNVIGGNNASTFGAASNVITLGNSTGSENITLTPFNSFTYAQALNVTGGNTGVATLMLGTTTGNVVWGGAITLNTHDLVIAKTGTTGATQVTGGITGTGNLTLNNMGTTGTITLATGAINNIGTITNIGAPTAGTITTLSASIGSNVTGVIQNSANSPLTLSGANSAFAGGVTLMQGTLNINSATALGTGLFTITAGTINNSSAGALVLSTNPAQTWNSDFTFTGTQALDLGTGAVSLGAAAGTARTITVAASTLTVGGGIADGSTATGLIKSGAGTLVLAGENTYSGGTTINAGILQVGNGGSTGSLGGGAVVNTTGLVFNRAGILNVPGAISGSGSITKQGSGTVVLSNTANTNNGAVTINGGTLSVDPSAITAVTSITIGSTTSGSVLDLYADGVAAVTHLVGGVGISLGGASSSGGLGFQIGASGINDQLVFSGGASLIAAAGGGVINASALGGFGAGSWTLVTGGTANAGTFTLGSLPGGYSYSLTSNATEIILTAALAAGTNYYWAGDVNGSWASAGTNTNWSNAPTTNTDPGATPGSGQTVTFSLTPGAQNYNTTLDNSFSIAGLTFADTRTKTGAPVSISPGSGGTLQIGSGGITVAAGAPTASSISAPVILGANNTWTVTDATSTFTVSGAISETGGAQTLTKAGAGTLVLSGANSHSGTTTVSAGILNIRHDTALGTTAGNTSVTSGAALQIQGNGLSIAESLTLVGSGLAGTGALRNLSGNNTWTGLITMTTPGARINSDAGLLTIDTAGNAIAGTGFALTLGGAGNGAIMDPVATGAAGTLIKDGAGMWTLTGANTYTGLTTIAGGTLKVGDGSTGSLNGTTGTALTFTDSGVFIANEAAGVLQGMGALTFTNGDGTVQSTWAGSSTNALIFTSLAARGAGASRNFVISGGVNGTDNKIVLTGATVNAFLDRGTFFGGSSYAWYDAAGFVRGINYSGTPDTGATTSGAAVSLGSATHQQITGAISAQATAAFSTLNISGNHNFTLAAGQTVTVDGILKSGNVAGGAIISGGTGITPTAASELVIRTDGANDALVIATPILANGANALTKSGNGTLTLQAANTYTGVTTVNAGILQLRNLLGAGTNAGGVVVRGGGTLQTSLTGTYATEALSLNGAGVNGIGALLASVTATWSGAVTVATDSTVNVARGATFITSGGMTYGGANVTKTGDGTWQMTTANNSGTTGSVFVNGGTLSVVGTNVALTGVGATVNPGATLQFTGTGTNSLAAAFIVAVNSGGVFDWQQTGAETFGTLLLNGSGINNAGALVNNAATTGGVMTITNGIILQSNATIGGATGSTLRTITGITSNGFTLTKEGAGAFISTNVTTGSTPFGAGSLVLNGGTLALVPGTAGSYAMVGANNLPSSTFTYGSTTGAGGSLTLTKNTTALSFTIGSATPAGAVLVRGGRGTLVIQPTALANLGAAGNENFVVNGMTHAVNKNGAAASAGIYDASVVALAANVGSFVRYSVTAANGFEEAGTGTSAYTVATAAVIPANTILDVTSNVTITTASTPYAVRVGAGITLTNGGTTTVNGGAASATNSGIGGVILNTATASSITGGTLAFGASEGAVFVSSTAAAGTIASIITGTAGVTKFGPGSLVLSGVNTFTGGLNLNQGTLNIQSTTALGAAASIFSVFAGTTVDTRAAGIVIANNNQVRILGDFTFTGTGALGLGTGAVTMTGDRTITATGGTLTLGGAITGTGVLTKAGAGVLTLAGANAGLTGGVVLSAGTLNLGSAIGAGLVTINGGTLSNSSSTPITFAANNAIQVGGNFSVGGTSSLNLGTGAVTLTTAASPSITVFGSSLTVGGVISEAGFNTGINKLGGGMLVLANTANTYTGVTDIAGTVNVASLADYGMVSSLGARSALQETATGNGVGIHLAGGTLQYTGSTAQSTNRQIRILNGVFGGAIDASGTGAGTLSFTYSGANTNLFDTSGTRTLTLTGSNPGANLFAIKLENQAASATSLLKTGRGQWVLTNNHAYTGTTTINNGRLTLDFASAVVKTNIISASSGLVLGGGVLNIVGDATATAQTFASTTLTAGTMSSLTASGGAGGLTINLGAVTRNLSSGLNLTFSGTLPSLVATGLTDTNGLIAAANGAAFVTVGGTDWGSVATSVTTYSDDVFSAGTNTNVTGSLSPAVFATNTLRFNTGAPTLTLTGANVVNAGGVLIGSGTGAVTIGGTGTLTGFAHTTVSSELNVFQYSTAAATLTASILNNAASPSYLAAAPVGTALNIFGSGTVVLNSNRNAYTGGTNISGTATLQLGLNHALPFGFSTPGAVTISGGATLDLNGRTQILNGLAGAGVVTNSAATAISFVVGSSNAASTFAGSIQNAGGGAVSFVKTGSGTLTLTGNSSYTGSTTLSQGTVLLDYANSPSKAPNILPVSALILGSATLNVTGSTVTNSQTFTGTTLSGGGFVTLAGTTPAMTVNLGVITRNAGSTLAVNIPSGTTVTTMTGNTGTSIMGGWAVTGTTTPTTWAVSGGNGSGAGPIGGLATFLTTTTAGNTAASYLTTSDVDVTSSPTLSGAVTLNSLRFNTSGANTVTLTGTNIITTGGLLVTGTVASNNQTISGGTLVGSSGGELIIHNYNTNTNRTITINSVIANNGTATGLTINGTTGVVSLRGVNTYTGQTVINGGVLNISLANQVGTSSGITLNGGTLTHADNFNMDRAITLGLGGGTLNYGAFDGNGGWSSTTAIAFLGSGPRTLTLGGDTDQDLATLSAAIGDGGGPTALVVNGGSDDSIFVLSAASTYTGTTTLSRGVLRLNNATAIGGGLTSAAATGNIIFTATAALRAVIETNATAGTITRALGHGPGQIHWEGNGGFSNNSAATQIVNLGGSGAKLTWGAGGFVPTGSRLQFGNFIANGNFSQGAIDFQNAIELGTGLRIIEASRANGTTTDRSLSIVEGILSGNITTSAGGGLQKEGNGTIYLTGVNSGGAATLTINAGALYFSGMSAIPGTGTNITLSTATGGNAAFGIAGDTNPMSSLGGRIVNPGTSTAAFLLSADSSEALDFTSYPNMRLAALAFQSALTTPTPLARAVTFTGSIMPTSSTYRLGGHAISQSVSSAAATLVLGRNNILTGANSLNMSFGGLTLTAANDYTGGTMINTNNVSVTVIGIGSNAAFGTGLITFAGVRQVNFGAVNGDHGVSNNIAFDGAAVIAWLAGGDTTNDSILSNANQGTLSYLGEVNLGGASRTITGRSRGTLFLGDITGSSAGVNYTQTVGGYFSFLTTSANGGIPKTYSGTTSVGDNGVLVIDSENSLGTSGNYNPNSSNLQMQPGTLAITLPASRVVSINATDTASFNTPSGSTLTVQGEIIGATTGGVNKSGLGTLVLQGQSLTAVTTGTLTIGAGKLRLDAAAAGGTIWGPAGQPLTLGVASGTFGNGGTLEITGTFDQVFGAVTVNPRANAIELTAAMTLTLGTITRTTGSTLNFTVPTGTVASTTAAIAGLVNGATTWNGTDWAAANGANISQYGAYATLTGTSGAPTLTNSTAANYLISSGTTHDITLATAGTVELNTLKFNDTAARTIDVRNGVDEGVLRLGAGGSSTVTRAGGVLVTAGSGALTIGVAGTAGTLTVGNTTANSTGDLVFINNSSNAVTVNSAIINNGTGAAAVVNSGSGKLILAGNNTFTGAIIVNSGVLEVATVNSTSTAGPLGQGTGAVGNILLNGGTFRANLSGNGATDKGFTMWDPLESTCRHASLSIL